MFYIFCAFEENCGLTETEFDFDLKDVLTDKFQDCFESISRQLLRAIVQVWRQVLTVINQDSPDLVAKTSGMVIVLVMKRLRRFPVEQYDDVSENSD